MIFPTFITISDANVSTTIGYIQDFLSDFTPILLPIIAVAIGIFIFWAIVKAIRP
ncbi:unnamed protein product [marine sediment metagenome]|uniref:Uncharacterized protein n=1 Tax=marine sediment metagenome TaxID=412755 RepID=X1PJG0_9ZZZZ